MAPRFFPIWDAEIAKLTNKKKAMIIFNIELYAKTKDQVKDLGVERGGIEKKSTQSIGRIQFYNNYAGQTKEKIEQRLYIDLGI